MQDKKPNRTVNRRNWLEQMAVPAALTLALGPARGSASGGSGVIGQGQKSGNGVDEKSLGARTYNVRDFGAKGDGIVIDTVAVQAAIDACNRDKGGIVLVPAGDFVVGK